MFILFLYTVTTITQVSESSKILAVFPTPSISHQLPFRTLTQALAQRGHEVVVITTDPAFPKGRSPANLTEIDVHDVSYTTWKNHFITTTTGKSNDLYTQLKVVMKLFTDILEKQLMNDEVQNIINDKTLKFDLLILEACVRPALVFYHIFKAPVILVSSLGAFSDEFEILGVPTHPMIYPTQFRQRLHSLTLWEKMSELYKHYKFKHILFKYKEYETAMIRKHFGKDTPSIIELSNHVDMLFLSVHPIWQQNQPVPPSVIYMGGIHIKQEKDLPKDMQTYLDSSKNGVIYISYGTNVIPSMLPPEIIKILLNVFSELPYDVLWKWDKDVLLGRSPNIRIEKWLPQSDLLRHPNVKLFITQGGLQSTEEAIVAGVPLIGMPMLGDQWYNVEHYTQHGIGLRLDMETLTENKLTDAIKTILNNDSYRRNIAQLRDIMYDQPQRPLERAVWWAEHVLRHGGARHLRAPAANMPWTQYYEVELVAIVLVGLLLIIALISLTLYSLWNIVRAFIKVKSTKVD